MSIQPYHEHAAPSSLSTIPEHEAWTRIYEPLIDLAGRLANSPFVPDGIRGDTAGTFSVLLAGHGLGLSPIQSLQSIVLIQRKPYISTEVILGLALRAGHIVQWGACDDNRATVRIVRGDGRGTAEATYTMTMAERAGLANKDNWRRMPAEMLRARAVRTALKMAAPDIALGLEAAENPAVTLEQPVPDSASTVRIQPTRAAATAVASQEAPKQAIDPQSGPQHQLSPETAETAPIEPQDLAEPGVTPRQLRKLNAMVTELERHEGRKLDPAERRALIGGSIGLPDIASAKDLTEQQASEAIEALKSLLDAAERHQRSEEPQEAPG